MKDMHLRAIRVTWPREMLSEAMHELLNLGKLDKDMPECMTGRRFFFYDSFMRSEKHVVFFCLLACLSGWLVGQMWIKMLGTAVAFLSGATFLYVHEMQYRASLLRVRYSHLT